MFIYSFLHLFIVLVQISNNFSALASSRATAIKFKNFRLNFIKIILTGNVNSQFNLAFTIFTTPVIS